MTSCLSADRWFTTTKQMSNSCHSLPRFIGGPLRDIYQAKKTIINRHDPSVVKGFRDISEDNKNIIRMEWINEKLTLIFIGAIVLITVFFNDNSSLNTYINVAVIIMLVFMVILPLFTGFKVNFLPFKLCPFIFIVAKVLNKSNRQ